MSILKKLFESFKNNLRNSVYVRLLINIGISIIFFFVYMVLREYTKSNPIITLTTVIISYLIVILVTNLIHRLFTIKFITTANDEISPILSNITLDLIVKLYLPAVICDDDGKIVWYNRALSSKVSKHETMYGTNLSGLCGLTPENLFADTSVKGIEVAAFDNYYLVKGYKLTSQHKTYCMVIWNEVTELNLAYKRLADEEMIVAYIIIDNLDELMQYVQDKYRTASSDVAQELKKWAGSVGGILKEYERDKFLFLFSAKYLDELIADKFDILDRIRNIRVGEGSLPVTVSIGISHIDATLSEKDKAARASLDMALQRGGDQVALKTEAGMDFYGGRTKTVQKRTKVKSRVIANELITLISGSSNVLLMCHRNADFDAIGACAGVARLVLFCGVKVNIIANLSDTNLTKCFEKLGKLTEYQNMFIDAASAQDLIGFDTLLIIVDVNNVKQYEALSIAENVHKTAIIDHHRKTAEFKEEPAISYIEPSASSSCELISEILEQTLPTGYLNKNEAEIMFAGILLDTKHFSRNTGTRTFSAALYLRDEGANPIEAQELFKTNLDDFMREAKFESNIVIYRNVIAIAVNDTDGNTSYDRIAAAKVADKLLSVDKITASFALCRIDSVIHISARSSGMFNVQIVLERLGGGGHYDSAATQVKEGTMSDALGKLKAAIDTYISENDT